MDSHAILVANTVIQRFHTRDPFEIIAQRKVKRRDLSRYHDLLGYYKIMNNVDVIGINERANEPQKRSAGAHEIGHLYLDRKDARSGETFQDTYFYSVDNGKREKRANTFAAELLLPDEAILEQIGYYAFDECRSQMEASLPAHCSAAFRVMKYQEMLREFYCIHTDIKTAEDIAAELCVEPHLVDFKLKILAENKGYEIPNLPELKSNFLKDCLKNA